MRLNKVYIIKIRFGVDIKAKRIMSCIPSAVASCSGVPVDDKITVLVVEAGDSVGMPFITPLFASYK